MFLLLKKVLLELDPIDIIIMHFLSQLIILYLHYDYSLSGRLNVSLVGVSPQGSRCNQLKRRPSGVDYCAFVGDNLTLSCRVNDPQAYTTIISPDGGSFRASNVSISPVFSFSEGTYLCNATNYCGNTDMLNLKVYGKES